MKTSVFGLLMVLYSTGSLAACPPVDTIVKEYGISHWGFQKHIPRLTDHTKMDWPKKGLLSVPLPTPDFMNDAFMHAIVINTETKEAWVSRTGGLAGVNEWYGPISVVGLDSELKSCAPAKPSGMTMNPDSLAAASYL